MSTIHANANGILCNTIEQMRLAVNAGIQLKGADFENRDDFSEYKSHVYYIQRDLSRLACAAKKGDAETAAKAKEQFYADFKKLMKDYLCGEGDVYVAGPTEAEAYLPHIGTFRKGADGQPVFTATGEASFRKSFERTVIMRIDGGEMRTAEELRKAREEKAAAKRAAAKAKKEAAKQEKPDGRPEEIDVHKDKKEQQAKKEGAAA